MTPDMTHAKHWNIPPLISPEADSALSKFPPILRQILFNRGYATEDEARAYLNAKPNTGNPSPSTAIMTWTA
jgi:hypothetical protein